MSRADGVDPAEQVAVVGLACRVPGAQDQRAFWRNLRDGVESISFFDDEQLAAAGVDPQLRASPRYVPAAGVLEGADLFDADLFGFGPREAAILDPQQRLLLECAWEALEDAGHLPERFTGDVAVYAGGEISSYLLELQRHPDLLRSLDPLQLLLGNDKDYLATRVSYKLDLTGPSVTVQTACSTSLVAVHLACQALLGGDCDMALAGGVSVGVPQTAGYEHQQGGILSADGHCRAFDADATGTVGSSGVGVVVLRRLADALADGDDVRAVIRGSAVNNDGAGKVGYTAPSVGGQAAVISEALAVARVDPATIGYVEAHGTATPLGDPIEIAALKRAFGERAQRPGGCALGTVKSNVGHLGAAAGVVGLIKAVLALSRRELPPTLGVRTPNPALGLEGSPFRLNTSLCGWEGPEPLRAGVSSFGIGGSNAHVVLEEAPRARAAPRTGEPSTLLLSARSPEALAASAARLAERLREAPELELADVAHTLATGRRAFEHRRAVACRSVAEAVDALTRGHGGEPLDEPARRWVAGEQVDWDAIAGGAARRRVSLPAHPLERGRHWLLPEPAPAPAARARPAARAGPAAGAEPPGAATDGLAAALAGIVAGVAGVARERIDAAAELPALGLDSLHLMEISRQIEREFGVAIDFRELYEDLPTIMRLAGRLERELGPRSAGATPREAAAAAPAPAAAAPAARGTANAAQPAEPAPRPPAAGEDLSERQRAYLDRFTARYTARTRSSKVFADAARPVLADARSAARFRAAWKELVYPIVGARSRGARIWDVDGNEYVDLAMGFGVNLFGHSPRFVADAIRRQLEVGMELGPQSALAAEVARLIAALTGMERVMFCNSGTEAVMNALRLARAVTGRPTVAQFAGAYHGSLDATLVRRGGAREQPWASPAAAGVTGGAVADTLVLEYGAPESLDALREHAGTLAAILVEPVQSRRPQLQPRAFLHELRALADAAGAALVFDEMITGFRSHPGGAQALFGVAADVATYGKVVGGGMPIGVVAGRARWLDAVDGGAWRFGDASRPRAPQTFTAGTFSKHPLAMAAARAVLRRIRAEGGALQERLDARTEALTDALAAELAQAGAPVAVHRFSSMFVFEPLDARPDAELLAHHLIEQGVHVWEGGTCFLSTAHDDEDVERVVAATRASLAALGAGGFLLPRASERPDGGRRVPSTPAQRSLWVLAQIGDEASAAYNEALAVRMRGELDVAALRRAVAGLVARHEALRTTFAADGESQLVHPRLEVDVPVVDLAAHPDAEERLERHLRAAARRPFDLARGPLLRPELVRLAERDHVLLVVIHHIVTDSWSLGILVEELGALYAAHRRGEVAALAPPARFGDFAARRAAAGDAAARAAAYWRETFVDGVPQLQLPTRGPRPAARTWAGERAVAEVEGDLWEAVRRLAGAHGCTGYVTLLATYTLLLHHLTGQADVVVGIHSAGQLALADPGTVGFCVSVLPFRSRLARGATFAEHLLATRRVVLEAFEHQACGADELLDALGVVRDPARVPLIATTFNLERAGGGLELPGLEVEARSVPTGLAKTELGINAIEGGEGLTIECTFNTDLLAAEAVAEWLERLRLLLAACAARPQATLEELGELLDEHGRAAEAAAAERVRRARRERLRDLGRVAP